MMTAATIEETSAKPASQRRVASTPAHTVHRHGIAVALYLFFWISLLLAGRSKFFQDPGVFWHTLVGNQILDDGTFVTKDSFTFTRQGEPWVAHQWLGEVSMAVLYRVGGLDAQLLAATALLSLFFTWMVVYLIGRGLNLSIATFLVVLVLATSSSHFHVRPHLATMIGMGVVFALLLDVDQRRRSIAHLGWLLPILVLWTNFHGGVLAGLATIGLVFAGWLLFACLKLPSPITNFKDALTVVFVGLLCLATPLCNPYAEQLPATWFTILTLSLPQMIQEHAPLHLRSVPGVLTLSLFAIYLVGILGLYFGPRTAEANKAEPSCGWRACLPRVTWLLPFVWMLLAVDRVRNVPLFASVSVLSLVTILPATHWYAWLVRREWWQSSAIIPTWSWRQRIAICVQGTFATVMVSTVVMLAGWARLDPTIWPTDLLPELTGINRRSPSGTKIFNTMHDGGFLEFHCRRLRVFIDDRCELFGESFLRDYVDAERNHPERIDDWQREYDFRWALVRNETPFDAFLQADSRWKKVRRGSCATLYQLRSASPHNGLVYGL